MNEMHIALQEHFPSIYHVSENEYRIDCPYCSDTSGHCHVNYKKRVFNCFKCGEANTAKKLFKDSGIRIRFSDEIVIPELPTAKENAAVGLPKEYKTIMFIIRCVQSACKKACVIIL